VAAPDLSRAIAASSSGITIADATRPGFPLTYANAAFEQLTGYDAASVVGRNCRFLQGRDTDPAAVAEIAAALREARECRVVLLNYRRDGSPFYNELRLAPVLDGEGRAVQIVGVQHDVTETVLAQRRMSRELHELRALQSALTPTGRPPGPTSTSRAPSCPPCRGSRGTSTSSSPAPASPPCSRSATPWATAWTRRGARRSCGPRSPPSRASRTTPCACSSWPTRR